MKKFIAVLAALLIIAGMVTGYGYYIWQNTSEDVVPVPEVKVLGKEMAVSSYTWYHPLFGGALTKSFVSSKNAEDNLGEFENPPQLGLVTAKTMDTRMQVSRDGNNIFSGKPEEWNDELLAENGEYIVDLHCVKEPDGKNGYGEFSYKVVFSINIPEPEPSFEAGKLDLQQGDIFSIRLLNIPEGVSPQAETQLGNVVFTPRESGGWDAAVAVANFRDPGDYPVKVNAGDLSWEVTVKVSKFNFLEQDLVIDTGSAQITEANSAKAYAQYREKIPPLFGTWDDQRYWDGMFIQPVQGRISTNFGEIRYTNGDRSNPRRHNGMDIAAAEGTEISAPNNGRVVLAEYLLNTGNTIVIEHGGGLKSYYFHMIELNVKPEDMVKTGDIIGAVGTTGYSTGPHLHFEMRIGDQPVSPQMLFEKDAGLYSLGASLEDEKD